MARQISFDAVVTRKRFRGNRVQLGLQFRDSGQAIQFGIAKGGRRDSVLGTGLL